MSPSAAARDMPLADDVAPLSYSYSFSMLEMVILEDAISYTFMSRNKRFIVDILAEGLRGEGGLVDTFYRLKNDIDDPDVYYDFETWVTDAVFEHIERLAPVPDPTSRMPTTLLDYYGAEKFAMELVNRNGVLVAIEHPYDPKLHANTGPRVAIIDSGTCDSNAGAVPLPDPAAHLRREERDVSPSPGHATVPRSVLPAIPSLPASQLVRAAGLESLEEAMCKAPQHVRDVNTGQEYFFKAAYYQRDFQREVQVLARILTLAEQGIALRTSRIAGLVYWDGREDVLMGMLLDRINGETLLSAASARSGASATDKGKWMDQIDETVGELHQHGLVWGDVNPDNVMITPSGDAVVIDFGGKCTLGYIDLRLRESREGDLQGIGKLRAELLGGL